MFLQLLCANGQPAYVDTREIAALVGYYDTRDGSPKLATRVIMKNREIVFVQGSVDRLIAEIEKKPHCPFTHCRAPAVCADGCIDATETN